ncbi:phosphoenolpyruvate synthase [Erythrobacter insulae]|uniref:Phosphoenolpyruvate synthase n=1 Tax=Erythrobacter insulae TaxID=2584124 RepID=A0A547PC56_9SPHN|nr:phosphoenolpyruvate synthase [Erythrobacter insulae]TRD11624.1 phosphoenolpyruvate synthase [Erythrobacter insulae]
MKHCESIRWFENLTRADIGEVGGKNASLGEMIGALDGKGIRVPPGFATTASAYRRFLKQNRIDDIITRQLVQFSQGASTLSETGETIRRAILAGQWPEDSAAEIVASYRELQNRCASDQMSVAVRSSATAEDLPDASFAGQQETFLNITGEAALLDACRRCFASLYTNRAIAYREAKGFDHQAVALSVGVQMMIRSDLAGAGVMFSIDTETGFDKVVLINAAWGLGESVVQGSVEPDEYQIFKPLLGDHTLVPIIEKRLGSKQRKLVYADGDEATRTVITETPERTRFVLNEGEILQLARWAVIIENHYGCPMDMEWAKDGPGGALFIVQARPETVRGQDDVSAIHSVTLEGKGRALTEGAAIGSEAASGKVCIIHNASDIDRLVPGSVLVTGITDPDWVPVMKRAAAIVTDHGGRTSHAAIVSRELGLPAIVGCGDATQRLVDAQEVTVSCCEGDRGLVYEGFAEIRHERIDLASVPQTRTQVMLNLADPTAAYRWWKLPADGVGLTRMEFVISHLIKAHPMALLQPERVKDRGAREAIERLVMGHEGYTDFYVNSLARGLARIAALLHPKRTIIRFSDFKTNEYADLIGGQFFEPVEENPMLGFRGASRYISPLFRQAFALECQAIKRLRDDLGFDNAAVMIPFCRTIGEADLVLEEMARNGLERGQNNLEVLVMCEVPSNVVLAGQFASRFDGFSIGSNDLTQLVLGIDRDSELLADQFDARDPAVKWMIAHVIAEAHANGTAVGLCGQAPSDHPDFAEFLVECGIDSISVTPDSFIAVKEHVAGAERRDRPSRKTG